MSRRYSRTEPTLIPAEEEPGHSYSRDSWLMFGGLIFWLALLIGLIRMALT
jgi:hypothetical protein